jgi:hypothetical protein
MLSSFKHLKRFHRRCGSFVVDVVEDQQPARMGRQPVEYRLGLGCLLGKGLLA